MLKKTLSIQETTTCNIFLECEYFDVEDFIGQRNVIIISDTTVYRQYSVLFKHYKRIIIDAQQDIKSFDTVLKIITQLHDYQIDRDSILIAIGGGTICDLTGFVATIYMRGISFGFVPTTLLAQVDAAIGGKNGVDFNNCKNLIGTINLPEFIVCHSVFLKTMPELQYKSGIGEIIKYSLISDCGIFETFADYPENFATYNGENMFDIIKKCINLKISIVEQDIKDKNIRHILNFGHSFAHCFEIIDDIPHGIAVVKGICVALDLSVKKELLAQTTCNKIKNMITALGFQPEYLITDKHFDLLFDDKKRRNDSIDFVFLCDIGDPLILRTPVAEIINSIS
jgi:3-dehydroquinate synthase